MRIIKRGIVLIWFKNMSHLVDMEKYQRPGHTKNSVRCRYTNRRNTYPMRVIYCKYKV